MARPDFPLSINRRRLLATGAAVATAAIALLLNISRLLDVSWRWVFTSPTRCRGP